MKIQGLAAAICLALIPCLYAESFTTNIVDGIETNAGPRFTLGATGPFNFLLVTNSGKLTNGLTIIGEAPDGHNNTAVVTDSNSVWHTGSFLLGYTGALNQVTVLNGARLITDIISLGVAAPSVSNSLTIAQGAQVMAGAVTSSVMGGGRNTIQVSGAGSLLRAENITIGQRGGANSLTITGGAHVAGRHDSVGFFTSENFALVSGAGSSWSNISLEIGGVRRNALRVENGASLQTGSFMIAGEMQNSAELVGTDTRLNATNVAIGGFGKSNYLAVSAGAALSSHNIQVGGVPWWGPGAGDFNLLSVSGSNALIMATNDIVIGFEGRSNRFEILDGAQVHSMGAGVIGENSGLRNSALVSGPRSVWLMTNELVVGQRGVVSSLIVSNGGFVRSQSGYLGTIGEWSGGGSRCAYTASSSKVHVTGHNSVWAIADSLVVGSGAIRNSLLITNGGRVAARDVIVGVTDGSLYASSGCGGMGGGGIVPNEVEIVGGNLDLDMNAVNTLEVRYGTLRLRSGAVTIGELLMTNQWSRFEFHGGSLFCSEALVDNRLPLVVGDGLHNAFFHANNITAPRGVVIREHAILNTGGRITANVTNSGTLSPFAFGVIVIASNFVQQAAGNLLINVGVERSSALTVSNEEKAIPG